MHTPSSLVRAWLIGVISVGLATTLFAASLSPVLIPTLYSGPGAYGSRWGTDVVLNNHDTAPFSSPGVEFGPISFPGIACVIPEGCTFDTIQPGGYGSIGSPLPANGLLLYLPREDAHISFMARFGSTRGNSAELPIVREHEFTNGRIDFPFVPLQSVNGVRTILRVYAPDAQPGTVVKVELRPWFLPEGAPQFSTTLALDTRAQTSTPPIYPGYAQLTLQVAFPDWANMGSTYNVSVVPFPLDSTTTPRIWAFLTITDNVTQNVIVQTPQ